MNISDWMKIKVIKNLPEDKSKLSIGENFLTGQNMIDQKSVKKKIGEKISFYVVKRKTKNSIEYIMKIDIIRRQNDEENDVIQI